MSLVLQSSGGGSVTLEEAVTASNLTITVPAVTATMAIDGPAFSAYQSTSQSIATTTYTKIQFQTELWDTANCFDNSSTYRFTPNVAGYYQVNGGATTVTTSTTLIVDLYKNGSSYTRLGYGFPTAPNVYGTSQVYLNGSTDYVELYVFQGAATQNLSNNTAPIATYFQGFLVRAA